MSIGMRILKYSLISLVLSLALVVQTPLAQTQIIDDVASGVRIVVIKLGPEFATYFGKGTITVRKSSPFYVEAAKAAKDGSLVLLNTASGVALFECVFGWFGRLKCTPSEASINIGNITLE